MVPTKVCALLSLMKLKFVLASLYIGSCVSRIGSMSGMIFNAFVAAIADHAAGIGKLRIGGQLVNGVCRRRVAADAVDLHVINVQIDGVERDVAGDGGVGEILHPALVVVAEAREMIAERPLGQHRRTAGQLRVAVNNRCHRVARPAAEKK